MDVTVEVRQVVLSCPIFDLGLLAIGSTVAVGNGPTIGRTSRGAAAPRSCVLRHQFSLPPRRGILILMEDADAKAGSRDRSTRAGVDLLESWIEDDRVGIPWSIKRE